MTTYATCRDIMKAAALGNSDEANRRYAELDDTGREAYNSFVIAMFAGAMSVRFEADQSLEAVRGFATEMQYDYRDAQPPVQAITVELVIRAMMGEENLFEAFSPEDQFRLQLLAIRKVVDQSDHMKSHLDDYLRDAETLAKQWASEDE